MGNANLSLSTEAKVKNPDRGPLLIIDGEKGRRSATHACRTHLRLQRFCGASRRYESTMGLFIPLGGTARLEEQRPACEYAAPSFHRDRRYWRPAAQAARPSGRTPECPALAWCRAPRLDLSIRLGAQRKKGLERGPDPLGLALLLYARDLVASCRCYQVRYEVRGIRRS